MTYEEWNKLCSLIIRHTFGIAIISLYQGIIITAIMLGGGHSPYIYIICGVIGLMALILLIYRFYVGVLLLEQELALYEFD